MAGTVAERDALVSAAVGTGTGTGTGLGTEQGTCGAGPAGGLRLALSQRSPFYLQKIEDGHLNNSLGSPVQADVYFPRLVNYLCLWLFWFFFFWWGWWCILFC